MTVTACSLAGIQAAHPNSTVALPRIRSSCVGLPGRFLLYNVGSFQCTDGLEVYLLVSSIGERQCC